MLKAGINVTIKSGYLAAYLVKFLIYSRTEITAPSQYLPPAENSSLGNYSESSQMQFPCVSHFFTVTSETLPLYILLLGN